MLQIGDTVKIIKNTTPLTDLDEHIGIIDTIIDVDDNLYQVGQYGYWWYEEELEKGHWEWIKDEY